MEQVRKVLGETGLAVGGLELEIVERVALQDESLAILNELSGLGVRISLDSFGFSSSLSCLVRRTPRGEHFPLSTLKIDPSFVSGVPGDAGNKAIVTAVITMAYSLKLKVIVEGVETEEQLTFLYSEGCDEAQGYLFSRPVPAGTLIELLHIAQTGTA